MAKLAMALLTVAGVSVIAMAVNAADMTAMDTNEDGMLSFDELKASYPDLEESVFQAVDVNGDGLLDETEVAAAEEAGSCPRMPADKGAVAPSF